MLEEKGRKFGPDCLLTTDAAIVLVTLAQLSTRIRNHADGSNHSGTQNLKVENEQNFNLTRQH
jgi:hypothetical protein